MRRAQEILPHEGWYLWEDDYDDSDGFLRTWYEARHIRGGHRLLQVSDFSFTMTQERFNWLVDNNFPQCRVQHSHGPVLVPWSNDSIDERIAADASSS